MPAVPVPAWAGVTRRAPVCDAPDQASSSRALVRAATMLMATEETRACFRAEKRVRRHGLVIDCRWLAERSA